MTVHLDDTSPTNRRALAVNPPRTSMPPSFDSPENWSKLIEMVQKSPLVFGAIDTFTSLMDSLSYKFEGSHPEKVQDVFDQARFDDWKRSLFFELLSIGNSFIELLFTRNQIESFIKIEDPTTIDIKSEGMNYLLDEYGRPVAYIQTVNYEKVEIPAEKIAHLKLYRHPGRIFGVGLVEPVYLYEKQRLILVSNLMEFAQKLNRPQMVVLHMPEQTMGLLTEEERGGLEDALRQFGTNGALLLDGNFKVEMVPTNLSSAWVPLLKVLTGEVLVGLGIPQALLFAELRTTPGLVRSQEKLFNNKINSIIKTIETEINRELIAKIDPDTKLVFERPTPLYLKEIVEMLGELARAGMLDIELVNKLLQTYWAEYPEVQIESPSSEGGETE